MWGCRVFFQFCLIGVCCYNHDIWLYIPWALCQYVLQPVRCMLLAFVVCLPQVDQHDEDCPLGKHKQIVVHMVVGLPGKVPEAVLGPIRQLHREHRNPACASREGIVGRRALCQATSKCVGESCLASFWLAAEINFVSIEGRDASLY